MMAKGQYPPATKQDKSLEILKNKNLDEFYNKDLLENMNHNSMMIKYKNLDLF